MHLGPILIQFQQIIIQVSGKGVRVRCIHSPPLRAYRTHANADRCERVRLLVASRVRCPPGGAAPSRGRHDVSSRCVTSRRWPRRRFVNGSPVACGREVRPVGQRLPRPGNGGARCSSVAAGAPPLGVGGSAVKGRSAHDRCTAEDGTARRRRKLRTGQVSAAARRPPSVARPAVDLSNAGWETAPARPRVSTPPLVPARPVRTPRDRRLMGQNT